MAVEIRTPTDDETAELFYVDGRSFGFTYSEADIEERRPLMDWSRFRAAYDDGQLVAMAGSFALDMTMPGGATVPTGGVTWVGVSSTHRRRGLLRQLMEAVHTDIEDRGEPLAALGSSEGGIYARFGYGIATRQANFEIDRRKAELRPEFTIADHGVRFIRGDEARAHVERIFETGRRLRAGDVSRSTTWFAALWSRWAQAKGGASEAFVLAHPQGYAVYQIEPDWSHGEPAATMRLRDLLALTPEAHVALWNVLLGTDLVATIHSIRAIPIDDPLPRYLANHRMVRTTDVLDDVWLRPMDAAVCFGARTYGTTDGFVIDIEGQRIRIDGSPEGAEVKRVRLRPDLTMTRGAAGSVLLGGERIDALHAVGQVTARDANTLRRADRFFLGDRAPHSNTMF